MDNPVVLSFDIGSYAVDDCPRVNTEEELQEVDFNERYRRLRSGRTRSHDNFKFPKRNISNGNNSRMEIVRV